MTTTSAPNVQAWLVKEGASLGLFVVRIGGSPVGFGALNEAH
jgi:hypothetical protein